MVWAIHAASAGSSASLISESRRCESARISQTRPAPMTRPTISSHQLNSLIGRQWRVRRRRIRRGEFGPACGGQYRQAGRRGRSGSAATLNQVFNFTPDPIALRIGPIEVHWYGIAYAVGLAAAYLLITGLARRRGLDANLVGNGMIVVAVAALIGGRLYHVIDRWDLYRDNLAAIVLPPYAGLGVYGGSITGTIAAWAYTRWKGPSVLAWADGVAPGLFLMHAIGRWGNFFNQELYGPPTTSPLGIPIDCAYRVTAYPCATFPVATTRFEPLFLYESVAGILGMVFLLFLGSRLRHRLRPG